MSAGLGAPVPAGAVVWEGRPELGLLRADALAGLAAALLAAAVLVPGLALGMGGLGWPAAARVGGATGLALGLGVALCRAAGAGRTLAPTTSFLLALATGAAFLAPDPEGALCPLLGAAASGALVAAQVKRKLATRYTLTAGQGVVGEPGRYAITFPLTGPALLIRDRFDPELADVEFPRVEATLTTAAGQTYRITPRALRFLRVRHPERLTLALHQAGSPGAPPAEPA